MICRQASQTENALILRCQATGRGPVQETTVCQTAGRTLEGQPPTESFAAIVSTRR